MIESIAQNEAKREIRKQVPLPTFEEFVNRKQPDSDFFLKPVALLTDAPLLTVAPPPEDRVMTDDPVVPSDLPETAAEMEPATNPTIEPATEPAIPEPAPAPH